MINILRKRLAQLIRFVWNYGIYKAGFLREFEVVKSYKIKLSSSVITDQIAKELFMDVYEKEERFAVQKTVQEHDRVLEIGAGMGVVTLQLLKRVKSEQVVALEANPRVFAILEKNMKDNGLSPKLINKAVVNNSDGRAFQFGDSFTSGSIHQRPGIENAVSISVMEINQLLNSDTFTTVVMDVEGAEIELVPSILGSSVDTLILELHPHIVGDQEISRLENSIYEAGFIKRYDASLGRVAAFTRSR